MVPDDRWQMVFPIVCSSHLNWLVHISDILCLNIGVLFACPAPNKFWESCKQSLYADPAHVHELPGHERCRGGRVLLITRI